MEKGFKFPKSGTTFVSYYAAERAANERDQESILECMRTLKKAIKKTFKPQKSTDNGFIVNSRISCTVKEINGSYAAIIAVTPKEEQGYYIGNSIKCFFNNIYKVMLPAFASAEEAKKHALGIMKGE